MDSLDRFGTWNMRSLYRACLLKTVSKDLSKNKLHLVGVQEVSRDRGKKVKVK
jgi:hypothetical protein